MRSLKALGLFVGGVVVLFIMAFGAIWIFNPFAPAVVVSDPEPYGYRIDDEVLIANFYPVENTDPAPAILFLGGSEGGIGQGTALALQKEGYAVLVPSYFRAPGQSRALELVPLELFDRAISWLMSQPDINSDRIGIMGISKGAEAALIVASRHPELRAVIAGMPSNVAWQGVNPNLLKQIITPPGGSWSLNGNPIPYLPYNVEEVTTNPLDLYLNSLATLSEYPDAIIPIEEIAAPILLICGEKDTLWPSCDMSRQIETRATQQQGPSIKLLAFDDAGHFGVGHPIEVDHPSFEVLASLGGSINDNSAARHKGWTAILAHLNDTLKSTPAE